MDIWGVTPPAAPFFDERLNAWSFSRYSDVSQALRDSRLLPASALSDSPAVRVESTTHANFRTQAQKTIAAIPTTQWEELANQMLPGGSSIDLIADYALPWSQRIAAMAAGVPDASTGACLELAQQIFLGASEPFDASVQNAAHSATAEMAATLEPIPMQMFVALSQSLPAFLSGAWLALLKHQDQLEGLDSSAIDELLRFAGPSRTVFRRSVEGVRIGGQKVETNQRVILHLDRANRDPLQFPAPEEFQASRSAAGHVAFGGGGHACVAGGLIRSAAWGATQPLINRLRTAELLSARAAISFGLRFWTTLQVRW